MSPNKLPIAIEEFFCSEIFPNVDRADEEFIAFRDEVLKIANSPKELSNVDQADEEFIAFREEVLKVANSPKELSNELKHHNKYNNRIKKYPLFQVVSELIYGRGFNNDGVRIFARIIKIAYNYVKEKKLPQLMARQQLSDLLSLKDVHSFVSVFKKLGFSSSELFLLNQYFKNPSLVRSVLLSLPMRHQYTDEQNKMLKSIRFVQWGMMRKLLSLINVNKPSETLPGLPLDETKEKTLKGLEGLFRNPKIDESTKELVVDQVNALLENPPVKLPSVAPELYKNRTDHNEDAPAFLRRVYGKYLEAGALYQYYIRNIDPTLFKAIENYCLNRKIKLSTILPPKKNAIDREIESIGAKEIDRLARNLNKRRKNKDI